MLRGAARAEFTAADGDVELEGSAATTWVERSLRGVTRMVVEVGAGDARGDGAPDGEPVERRCAPTAALARVSPRRPAAVPAAPGAGSRSRPGSGARAPSRRRARAPSGAGRGLSPRRRSRPRVRRRADRGDPCSADRGAEGDRRGDADRITDRFPEHDRDRDDRPVARLVFSSGEARRRRPGRVVGRAPRRGGFTAHEQPRLVTGAEPAPGDLLDPPGGPPGHGGRPRLGRGHRPRLHQRHRAGPAGPAAQDLRAGLAVQLIPGAVLDLGDGVTIQVSDD